MAGAGLIFDQFNFTEDELQVSKYVFVMLYGKFTNYVLQKVSKFITSINAVRAKNDKQAIQREEACKFMLATNFDVNAAIELARNYEVTIYIFSVVTLRYS